jgi:hypothetical protein
MGVPGVWPHVKRCKAARWLVTLALLRAVGSQNLVCLTESSAWFALGCPSLNNPDRKQWYQDQMLALQAALRERGLRLLVGVTCDCSFDKLSWHHSWLQSDHYLACVQVVFDSERPSIKCARDGGGQGTAPGGGGGARGPGAKDRQAALEECEVDFCVADREADWEVARLAK